VSQEADTNQVLEHEESLLGKTRKWGGELVGEHREAQA